MDSCPLAHYLLLDELLSSLRISGQLVKFLLCCVFLGNFQLSLDFALYGVFVLGLDLLTVSQHVSKLVCKG